MQMFRLSAILWAFLLAALIVVQPADAVNPDEVLSDPALEKRARDLSANLRCMVCQNQSIDDSDADLARDLRLLVRERLTAGDSDNEVLDYLIARYGEFVLLRPRFSARTYLLWGTPLVLLVPGAIVLFFSMRNRSRRKQQPLSSDEKAALAKILGDREEGA